MLFCPFCGHPIVVPDEEGDALGERLKEATLSEDKNSSDNGIDTGETDKAEDEFKPLVFDLESDDIVNRNDEVDNNAQDMDVDIFDSPLIKENTDRGGLLFDDVNSPVDFINIDESDGDELEFTHQHHMDKPVRLTGRTPKLNRNSATILKNTSRSSRTYVPKANNSRIDIDNLFMDSDYDEGDEYDDIYVSKKTHGRYEEAEKGSFLMRHIRGFVSLVLMLILVAIVAMWIFSSGGQQSLAKVKLAWNPSVYADIAREAYDNGAYVNAAQYYAEALKRAPDNYTYAINTAICYMYAEQFNEAEIYIKEAISIDPYQVEPYVYLRTIYSDVLMPDEIKNIIVQGYANTGDERLNIT